MFNMVNGKRIGEGTILQLPCEVKNGFFPDEAIIRILIGATRVIVGHVSSNSIIQKNGSKFIPALIMGRPEKNNARVFLPGEVVSETNPVTVPLEWLSRFF
jgi:hypothetical protein